MCVCVGGRGGGVGWKVGSHVMRDARRMYNVGIARILYISVLLDIQ